MIKLPVFLRVPVAGSPVAAPPAPGLVAPPSVLANPWVFPPDEADYWSDFSSATVAPGATVTLSGITLPDSQMARIYGLGLMIRGAEAVQLSGWANTVWSLRINGEPHRSYGDIRDQISVASDLTDVVVMIDRGAVVTLEVTNNHALDSFVCFARLLGWSFPTAVMERYREGR